MCMKRLLPTFFGILFLSVTGLAQTDTVATSKTDTVFNKANIVITISPKIKIKDRIKSNRLKKNITTNRWVIDLGFSNYVDYSNYPMANAGNLVGLGVDKERMEVNDRKLTNVNIWFFRKKINLIQHIVNLKYGAGLELNNYRFKDAGIYFQKSFRIISYQPLSEVKKAKLAVDYFTVPLMLNLNFTPNKKKEIGFSGGVSFGYLYSARFKSKTHREIYKVKDDFNLNRWKLSYIGEVSLGRTSIYGSYAFRDMWANELNMVPFTIGVRLGH